MSNHLVPEDVMSEELSKRSRFGVVDTVLVGAGIVGAILVVLWVVGAVAHLVLFAFKIAILVIVVMGLIRLVHLFTRGRN